LYDYIFAETGKSKAIPQKSEGLSAKGAGLAYGGDAGLAFRVMRIALSNSHREKRKNRQGALEACPLP
jgi:hypothetical protein